MIAGDAASQRRIQLAAIEQERECGVLADENSPRLSLEARNRVHGVRVGPLAKVILEATYPHILRDLDLTTFLDRLAPDRPEKMTATFELELQGYAAYEFNLLAKEYVKIAQSSTELDQWLKNLSGLVEREVFRRWLRKWDLHVSREVQRQMVRMSLEECVVRWSKKGPAKERSEPVFSPDGQGRETGGQEGSGSNGKRQVFQFPDFEVEKEISGEMARLQSRIFEANAECTITDFDTFIVDTLLESLNMRAGAYLQKVTKQSQVPEYVAVIQQVGAALLQNAEERSHLRDPYSEKRLREIAETTGSLINRRKRLTPEQYEEELQGLIEDCRTSVRTKAAEWQTWKNQITARIYSRFEARYLYWSAEAIDQTSPEVSRRIAALAAHAEALWTRSVEDRKRKYQADLAALHTKNVSFGGRSVSALRLCREYLADAVATQMACYKEVQAKHSAVGMLTVEALEELRVRLLKFVDQGIVKVRSVIERDKRASGDPGPLPPNGRYSTLQGELIDVIEIELKVVLTEGAVLASNLSSTNLPSGLNIPATALGQNDLSRVPKPKEVLPETSDSLTIAAWEDLEITFTSEHRLQLKGCGRTETGNYKEMGFADGRNSNPNAVWSLLRLLAESGGTVRDSSKSGKNWSAVEKGMQKLRKRLIRQFALKSDPLPFKRGIGYRAQFKIGCGTSYKT